MMANTSPRSSKAGTPKTPSFMSPLSRELEAAIAQRNQLTARSRTRLAADLAAAADEQEAIVAEDMRAKAVAELIRSERSYLRHLEIVREFFMTPLEARAWLPRSDFVSIFGDLPAIEQVNRELLAALEASKDRVGQVFLDLAPYLKFYSTYAQVMATMGSLPAKWASLCSFRSSRRRPRWSSDGRRSTRASGSSFPARRRGQRCSSS